MIPLASLWLPVLLAAVLVFVASSLLHMVLKLHNADYRRLPNEDEVRAAIRKGGPAPGQYVLPHGLDRKELDQPEVRRKFEEGPVALLWLKAPGLPAMGPALGGWLAYTLVISFCTAYLGSRTLGAGTPFLQVFRVTSTVAFLAYAGAAVHGSLWMGKPWRVSFLELADGLVYGLITGACLGGFWPR